MFPIQFALYVTHKVTSVRYEVVCGTASTAAVPTGANGGGRPRTNGRLRRLRSLIIGSVITGVATATASTLYASGTLWSPLH